MYRYLTCLAMALFIGCSSSPEPIPTKGDRPHQELTRNSVRDLFQSLNQALVRSDKQAFEESFVDQGMATNLVGEGGLSGSRLYALGRREKWSLRPILEEAEPVGKEGFVLPVQKWLGKKGSRGTLVAAVSSRNHRWILVGVGRRKQPVSDLLIHYQLGLPLAPSFRSRPSKLSEKEKGECVQWINRGVVSGKKGNVKEARKCFQKALEISPHYGKTWYNLGYSYRSSGDIDRAILCYRQAVRYDRGNYRAWYNLANGYGKKGRHVEAVDCYEQSLKINGNRVKCWLNLANSLAHLGRFPEAMAAYDRVLKLDPDHPVAPANRKKAVEAWNEVKRRKKER